MKRFQKKRGLHIDGVARPGGPTETNLNSALAEGLTQVRPVTAPSKPARDDEDNETRAAFGATPKKKDRQRSPKRSPLGVPPKRPKVFDVSAGVGQGQLNGRYDVRGAKHALAWAGYYPKDKAQTANGRVDDDLTWGIWDFQRDHKLKQDGTMLPGGETATALNALVAPLVRAAFGAAEQLESARIGPEQIPDGAVEGGEARFRETKAVDPKVCEDYYRRIDRLTQELAEVTKRWEEVSAEMENLTKQRKRGFEAFRDTVVALGVGWIGRKVLNLIQGNKHAEARNEVEEAKSLVEDGSTLIDLLRFITQDETLGAELERLHGEYQKLAREVSDVSGKLRAKRTQARTYGCQQRPEKQA
jgi:molecular chaperone GrpE (heat shock protein)/peptidoglycan hydrolase-like protein with peptidoglycan-binding domain